MDLRKAWPWWKAKKWVLHIAYRLFSRYAVPKACKGGNDKQFATKYKVGSSQGWAGCAEGVRAAV